MAGPQVTFEASHGESPMGGEQRGWGGLSMAVAGVGTLSEGHVDGAHVSVLFGRFGSRRQCCTLWDHVGGSCSCCPPPPPPGGG